MISTFNPFCENSMPNPLRFVKPQLVLAIALLGLVPTLFTPTLSQAQTPPAETYQPGFWQPVGRFDPKQPVKINLVNETGLTLDYDITNIESFTPAVIPSNESRLIENFSNDAYIMIYPDHTSSMDTLSQVLKFSVAVDSKTQEIPADNIATITVTKTAAEPDSRFYGHRTINFQKSGAIYFY